MRISGEWEEWILYILKGIEQTAKQTINQIKEINRLFIATQEKIKLEAEKLYDKELVELLFEQPYCKIEYVIERLGVPRITASKYLKGLEEIGILESRRV